MNGEGGEREGAEYGIPDSARRQLSAARLAFAEERRRSQRQADELARLHQQIVDIGASPTYRFAQALSEARRSWRGLMALPGRACSLMVDMLGARPVKEKQVSLEPGQLHEVPRASATPESAIALIADAFTEHGLAPELPLLALTSDAWRQQLAAASTPAMLFVESAWRGNHDSWRGKLVPPSSELIELLDWCNAHEVPTVFWNKEDPVHFDHFIETARHFDHVFTTDAGAVCRYRQEAGIEAGVLPFATQPRDHHPLESFARKDAFGFAGSYYRKYPERQRDFQRIVDRLRGLAPVEIIDRNLDRKDPDYAFPEDMQALVVGTLAPDEIEKAYKGYRFAININTVKDSPTMCARRVFDLLASNTPVVSNPSASFDGLFGTGTVLVIDEGSDAEAVAALTTDSAAYRRHRLRGLRRVMQDHTWRNRLVEMFDSIGLAETSLKADASVVVLSRAFDEHALRSLVGSVRRQTHRPTQVWVLISSALTSAWTGEFPELRFWNDAGIMVAEIARCKEAWVAWMDPSDHYGANYLLDLQLAATRYARHAAVGKSTYLALDGSGEIILRNSDGQYRSGVEIDARRGLFLAAEHVHSMEILLRDGSAALLGDSIDEFNYVEGGANASPDILGMHADA